MNRTEVTELLTLAVACEAYPREISDTDVLAWHELLRDIAPEDAAGAVRWHYSRSSLRLTPADVRRYVSDLRAGRIAKALDEAPPVDPDDVPGYVRSLANRKRLLGDGRESPLKLGPPAPPPEAITSRDNRLVAPLLKPCDWCKAAPRQHCTTSTGRRLRGFHPCRIEAANRKEQSA